MRPLLVGALTVETVTVPIRGLPSRLEGCRIVQLSDFHYDGQRLSQPLLDAAIAQANALQPDLIALTGDYITHSHAPMPHLADCLSQLQSRHGIVAILGNHDNHRPGNRSTVLRELRRVGVHVLWNQVVYPLGEDFPVVGLAEFWSREFAPETVLSQLSPTVPRLVLVHNPDSAPRLAPWRVDLQLSGHTHGGQIILPGLGIVPAWVDRLKSGLGKVLPIPTLRRKGSRVLQHWEWASGLHRVGESWLYVNRGLGTYAPGRWRCPPELTVLTLVGQPEDDAGLPEAQLAQVPQASFTSNQTRRD